MIFNIANVVKGQHYSVEMSQLTGRFQMGLIIDECQYTMEMKFAHVHFERPLIIDPNNVKNEIEIDINLLSRF